MSRTILRRVFLALGIVMILAWPSIFPVLATMPLPGFTKYTFRGTVRDTSGSGRGGVNVYVVAKGRYSLDSAWAVVQMENDFNDVTAYMATTSSGSFAISAAVLNTNFLPDSVGVMVDVPRVFGSFKSIFDTTATQIPATERDLQQNTGGCSCSPTASIVTYQGTERVWENYTVVLR